MKFTQSVVARFRYSVLSASVCLSDGPLASITRGSSALAMRDVLMVRLDDTIILPSANRDEPVSLKKSEAFIVVNVSGKVLGYRSRDEVEQRCEFGAVG